jgi:hypothetical protein
MWLGMGLMDVLLESETNPFIGEVLVINNAPAVTPKCFTERRWSKVKTISFGRNIYVNPAWNIGVQDSKYDQLCIMNDDIRFDLKVFEFMSDKLDPSFGPAGPAYPNGPVDGSIRISIDPIIRWTQLLGTAAEGWGTMMFMNKANWLPIPQQLKIFSGDDWIYDNAWVTNKFPRTINNFHITSQNGRLGTTSQRPEFSSIKDADKSARSLLNNIWPTHGN